MKNKILMSVSLLLLIACASSPEVSTTATVSGQSGGLTFLHLNDTYRVDDVEDGTRGGFGRVVTIIRQLQAEGRKVHVFHGGDLLSPSLESEIWFGGQMVDGLNFIDALAPTYLVAGNHDFDFRDDDLAYFINAIRSSEFDWLGDNYRFVTDDPVADAAVKTAFTFAAAGKRFGVFALTLHPDAGGTTRGYVEYDRDYLAIARAVISQLEAQNVDMIIGLTHLYLQDDELLATLRREHPKLHFIVGGHDHEMVFVPPTDNTAAVYKGSSNARVIWRIDVEFDDADVATVNARALTMDSSVVKDPTYQVLADKWHAELQRLYPVIAAQLGQAAAAFDVTEERVRSAENGWGNFLVDTARHAFGKPAADFAFVNSGSIRIDDAIANDISYEDVARTFGFPSHLRRIELSGAEMRELMEAGYRGSGTQGYFPQISGFRVCVDRSRPDYERIVSLQVPVEAGWDEIDPERQYSLVLPDFIFGDQDGYVMPPASRESASSLGPELKYLAVDAIIKSQFLNRPVGAAVDPAQPRFVELGPARPDCWD